MQILDVILKEDKQKLYAIGDSHANAVGKTSGFINFSTDGRSAFSQDNITAINQVEPGSLVVLSAGANDTYRDNKGAVVMRVEKMLNMLLAKDCEVYYILFGNLDSPNSHYRNNLRTEIQKQLPAGVEVLDMGALQPNTPQSKDGIHRSDGWYSTIASQLKAKAGPNKVLGAKQVQSAPELPSTQQPAPGAQKVPPGQSGQKADPVTQSAKTAPQGAVSDKPTGADAKGKVYVAVNDIKGYLKSKGLDYKQVAGILNNIEHESSFQVNAYNPNDRGARAIGLFQHRASRADNLERAVRDWRTNWKGQVDFALSEDAGKEYASTTFKNATTASLWWTARFEVPQYTKATAVYRLGTLKKYID